MEVEEIEYLYGLRRFGMKMDLSVMRSFSEMRGRPQDRFRSVHIAGTNGKGSVAMMMYRILREKYSVGLYTSPHLVSFTERIIVDDEEIPLDFVVNYVREMRPLIEELARENRNPTFFEVTTMMAFEYFSARNVDFAVLEVGLGGRLDATNVVVPEVSVITSIDYDHTHILGDTLTKIAREKAGIIKAGVPVVVGRMEDEPREEIRRIAEERGAPFHYVPNEVKILNVDMDLNGIRMGVRTPVREYSIETPMLGEYQIENIITAIRVAELLGERYGIGKEEIERGLKKARWKDRFEVKMKKPLLIFDSAHNHSAARYLVRTVERLGIEGSTFLFSMVSDKNLDGFLKEISKVSRRIVVSEMSYQKRKSTVEELGSAARKYFEEVIEISDPCEALNYVLEREKVIIATGSIYFLGDLEKCLERS